MKKILKYRSLFIAIMTAICFAVPASPAEKENNMQNPFPESKFVDRFSSSGLRGDEGDETEGTGNVDPGGRPNGKDALGPIGDAIGWVAALALTYGVCVFNRKRKNATNV